MANSFCKDIQIHVPDPRQAARFYVEQLGFGITSETPDMISLEGDQINFYIERGPLLGPILEVFVDDVEQTREQLKRAGCEVVKDEPSFPRCYVKDRYGLIYNLRKSS